MAKDIADVNASFFTRHRRAQIVVNKLLEANKQAAMILILLNRTAPSPEIENLCRTLYESPLDVAEIIDGFKDDFVSLIEIQVQDVEQHLEKYKEIVARCEDAEKKVKEFTSE